VSNVSAENPSALEMPGPLSRGQGRAQHDGERNCRQAGDSHDGHHRVDTDHVAEPAIGDRRQGAAADRAGVEDAEGGLATVGGDEFGNGAVECWSLSTTQPLPP